MKKIFLLVFILTAISITVYADDNSIGSNNIYNQSITYKDTTIVIDNPVSLDAYVICYNNNTEIWHSLLYSYDYLNGIPIEAQKVSISSYVIEDEVLKIVDSRGVIYYLDPNDGTLIKKDETNYVLPDFSDVSMTPIPNNSDGMIKYIAIFIGFIGVGLIVFIASRNKK